MRRLTVGCVLAVPIAALILYACSPFDSPAASSGGVAEAGTANETSVAQTDARATDVEYDIPLEDGGSAHCWDFQQGTSSGFTAENVSLVAGTGYVIAVDNNTAPHRILRTFDAGKNINITTIRIDETVSIAGDFSATSGFFSDGFAEFYGPNADGVVRVAFEYAQARTEFDIYDSLTSTTPSNTTTLATNLSNFDGFVWVDTVWGNGGNGNNLNSGVAVSSADALPTSVNQPTLVGESAQTAFTIVVGGNSSDPTTNPTVNIVVRSVCVSFH